MIWVGKQLKFLRCHLKIFWISMNIRLVKVYDTNQMYWKKLNLSIGYGFD